MRPALNGLAIGSALLLGGCVVMPPSGPSLQALPGSRSSFAQFQFDDAACRDYATAQIGGRSAAQNAQDSAATSALAGTAIGAAAGAAIGGNSQGAAVGAGIGLLTGAMAGLGASETSYYATQRRFDSAYYQCMYARGHKVPVSGRYAQVMRARPQQFAPPPDAAVPPPNAPPPDAAVPPPNAPPPAYVPPYWPNPPAPR